MSEIDNLLENPSFEDGAVLPEAWEWVVKSGRPYWKFDHTERLSGKRSVVLMQDTGKSHGEFRQIVPAAGARRYRLRGRIKGHIEGAGEESGANLCLRSLSGGREIGIMRCRPFFLGRCEWDLWMSDYVTPAATDALLVSFDMRNGDGAAWFDEIELFEVPKPLAFSAAGFVRTSASAVGRGAVSPRTRKANSAQVFSDADVSFLVSQVLCPLLGSQNVDASGSGRLAAAGADAVFVFANKPAGARPADKSRMTFAQLERLCDDKIVILTPEALVEAVGNGGVGLARCEDPVQAPGACIQKECFLSQGLTKGDVFPWCRRDEHDVFAQVQIDARSEALSALGFETIATSVTGTQDGTGRPVILWRQGSAGGILVVDLEILNSRPRCDYRENLGVIILANALGRPQTSLGAYVVPDTNYDTFCRRLHNLTQAHPSIRLKEENTTDLGKPIYSFTIGREDAPVFFVDCGIHPYEWAPTFGALIYISRLADEYEHGLPWAKTILEQIQLKCVPLYAPDVYGELVRDVNGVNLNRNFPPHWDAYEANDKGRAPLSRVETRTIAEILRRDRIVAAVNWHETNAGTNWVGAPGFQGRYEKYATSIPAIFQQIIDPGLFFWQAATWTQNTDRRNFHYHYMDSFPYLRDYGESLAPYEIHYADSLGIDGLLVEQYGNSDISCAATPQRTDLTGRIIEMLLGLQIGLVCRNHATDDRVVSIPLLCGEGCGEKSVFTASGLEVSRKSLAARGGRALVEAVIPPQGVLVVNLAPAPWQSAKRPTQ
ncbi:MAG: hypothetical protein J7M19_08765 [Planctomycetes bacterium]|nr:hypothetical protein [Planctomycetota bacterium]